MLTRRRGPTPRHVDADYRRFLEACTLVNAPCPAAPIRCPPGSQVRRVFYPRYASIWLSSAQVTRLKNTVKTQTAMVTWLWLVRETSFTILLDHRQCHRQVELLRGLEMFEVVWRG